VTERGVIGEPDDYVEADLSPDGSQIAVEINDKNGFGEIWVVDVARGSRIPFTRTSDVWEYAPRWSPDGRHLAYSHANPAKEGATIRRKLADGSGNEEILAHVTPMTLTFLRRWTPDGHSILFAKIAEGLFSAPVGVKGEVAPLASGTENEINARVSPDGKWLAYTTTETGRRELYVRPLKGGQRTLISIAGGGNPQWNGQGTELYYHALDGTVMATDVSRSEPFRASEPKPLFKIRPSRGDDIRQSFSTTDGQRFLVRNPDESSPPSITWAMNWPALVAAAR
jgi:serine/threonine-protein kinase